MNDSDPNLKHPEVHFACLEAYNVHANSVKHIRRQPKCIESPVVSNSSKNYKQRVNDRSNSFSIQTAQVYDNLNINPNEASFADLSYLGMINGPNNS